MKKCLSKKYYYNKYILFEIILYFLLLYNSTVMRTVTRWWWRRWRRWHKNPAFDQKTDIFQTTFFFVKSHVKFCHQEERNRQKTTTAWLSGLGFLLVSGAQFWFPGHFRPGSGAIFHPRAISRCPTRIKKLMTHSYNSFSWRIQKKY